MKSVRLTDFERDVTISLLETALSAWEGDEARQNAARTVVQKMKEADRRKS